MHRSKNNIGIHKVKRPETPAKRYQRKEEKLGGSITTCWDCRITIEEREWSAEPALWLMAWPFDFAFAISYVHRESPIMGMSLFSAAWQADRFDVACRNATFSRWLREKKLPLPHLVRERRNYVYYCYNRTYAWCCLCN